MTPRRACAAAMFDEQHVETVVVGGINDCLERIVRLCRCELPRDKPEAFTHALTVGVDGHRGSAQAEQQHACSGFRSNARQGTEPAARLGHSLFEIADHLIDVVLQCRNFAGRFDRD